MKKTATGLSRLLWLAFAAAALCGVALNGQQRQGRGQGAATPNTGRGGAPPDLDNVAVHVLPVQGSVYMLVGAGGNVTVQVGKDGVLLVDTSFAQMSNKLLAAIRTLSTGPIRYVIDTHVHPDHVGGNEHSRKAGSTIAGRHVAGDIQD